jgi:hypothetical protein
MRDLVEALGSHDAVMDAYVLGLLPAKAIDAIELTDPARLQCWLLARILRLALAQAAPRPRTP